MCATLLNLIPVLTPAEFVLLVIVACAAASDLQSRTISNNLVLAALVSALPLHALIMPWPPALQLWATGALTGLALFLPLYLLRGMAAGDVKLMAAVGAFVGPALAFEIAMSTFVIGGGIAFFIIVLNGKLLSACSNIRALLTQIILRSCGVPVDKISIPHASVGNLPYAVAIALGTIYIVGMQN